MKMQTTATLRDLRMTPRKMRLLVDMVRGMTVQEALAQLSFSKKHAATPVKKLLESAVANAQHNHNLKEETLVIKTAFVNEGATLYRWMPRAMGRATPIRKRTSHITVVLEGEVGEAKKATKKVEAKEHHDHDHEGHTHEEAQPAAKKKTAARKTAKKKEAAE